MGMTKALMGGMLIAVNGVARRFVRVRYANVTDRAASVVPPFLHQTARGGPVTVTTKG